MVGDANPVTSRHRWTGRARYKSTAAVWADVAQDVIHAGFAERAFIRADHCFRVAVGQILIAAFTIGSEFQGH